MVEFASSYNFPSSYDSSLVSSGSYVPRGWNNPPGGWSTIVSGASNSNTTNNLSNVWASGTGSGQGAPNSSSNALAATYNASITNGIAVDGGSIAIIGSGGSMRGATALSGGALEALAYSTIFGGLVARDASIFAGAVTVRVDGSPPPSQALGPGAAYDPIVASGGRALVGGGGSDFVAKGYHLNGVGGLISGGTFNPGSIYGIGTGGTAKGGTVGGALYTFSGGTSTNQLFVGSSAVQYIVSHGQSINATVISGGTLLNAGGTTSGAIAARGATLSIAGGTYFSWMNSTNYATYFGDYTSGTSFNNAVSSGATEIVGQDGITSNSTVFPSGTGLVSSGGTAVFPLISGGTEIVSSSGTIISGTVNNNGGITLSSGGYGTALQAAGSGSVQVSFGATGSSITADSGGTALIQSGASAGNLIVKSGGTASIASGAIIYSGATINNAGGSLVLPSGATADYLVASSGTATENSGATLGGLYAAGQGKGLINQSGVVVGSAIAGYDPNNPSATGGTIIIQNGASASSLGALSGGTAVLGSGGTAGSITPVSGGTATIQAGAQLTSGATINVLGNGVAAGFLGVDSGNHLAEVDIGSSGTARINSGATADLLSAGSGGSALLTSGASASNVILNGAMADISGGATAPTVSALNGGTGLLESGAVVQTFSALNSGTGILSSGAFVQTFSALNGGTGILSSGASLNSMFLSSGNATINSGASISQLTIMNGGTGILRSGASVQNVDVAAGGLVSGANITNNNTMSVASGGTSIGAVISYASGGQVSNPYNMISSGGTLSGASILAGTGAASSESSLGGLLTIASGATLINTSMGYNARIRISGLSYGIGASATIAGNTVTVSENGTTWSIGLSGSYDTSPNSFIVNDDGQGNTVLIYQKCFLAGSMIRTPRGEKPVERLRKGETISVWQDGKEETREITAVIQRRARVNSSRPEDMAGWSVIVAKDAFAPGQPSKDLSITPEHCFFLEGRFVPVRMLINGRSIRYDHSQVEYDYYHVQTKPHAIIWANDTLTESWLDTDMQDHYEKDHTGAMRLAERAQLNWAENAAAPLEVGQAFVKPLHDGFSARATELGFANPQASSTTEHGMTSDPAPYIQLENGTVIQPQRHEAGRYVFILPAYAQLVTIGSRQFRPSEAEGPYVDDRRVLGMLIGQVSVWTGGKETIITRHLTDDTLAGWDVLEAGPHRWTQGKAKLPLHDGPVTGTNQQILSIEVQAGGPYKLDSQNGSR